VRELKTPFGLSVTAHPLARRTCAPSIEHWWISCIRAGCRKDGVPFSTFAGSGSSRRVDGGSVDVADLIEINPDYAEIARTDALSAVLPL
jgi:hypothetical protein